MPARYAGSSRFNGGAESPNATFVFALFGHKRRYHAHVRLALQRLYERLKEIRADRNIVIEDQDELRSPFNSITNAGVIAPCIAQISACLQQGYGRKGSTQYLY